VQVHVIPVSDRHNEYAYKIEKEIKKAGLRIKVDDSGDRMQAKIRRAQLEKIPYMVILGDREIEQGSISVRLRTEEELGSMNVAELIDRIKGVIEDKKGL
jgi:threonyl-tRNA synthetase